MNKLNESVYPAPDIQSKEIYSTLTTFVISLLPQYTQTIDIREGNNVINMFVYDQTKLIKFGIQILHN